MPRAETQILSSYGIRIGGKTDHAERKHYLITYNLSFLQGRFQETRIVPIDYGMRKVRLFRPARG
jgi:hypothetical protein